MMSKLPPDPVEDPRFKEPLMPTAKDHLEGGARNKLFRLMTA